MGSLQERIAGHLSALEADGLRRRLVPTDPAPRGTLRRGDATLLDFAGNDYLGLSAHPALVERAREWTSRLGTGSGASRLVSGTRTAHLDLEARIAAFKGTEAALLFASGWQANATILPALLRAAPGAMVFTDRLVHASMHAGCAAAGVRQARYRHNNLADLRARLSGKGADAPARIIMTESVFSMDGDLADIAALRAFADEHDAFLIVDEAHATGVLGPRGAGLAAGADIVMGTFSKAMGSFGAYVAASRDTCALLSNAGSGFVYSTAPPPPVLGAIDAALDLVPGMDAERAHIAALGEQLRAGLAKLGLDTRGSASPVVPAVIGEVEATMRIGEALAGRGFLAGTIRPPTVPKGTSRLRMTLRASHRSEDVQRLLEAISEAL